MQELISEKSTQATTGNEIVTASEAVEFGKYSVLSDVLSFGALLRDLFSFSSGKIPFPSMTNHEASRLERPNMCPQDLWDTRVPKEIWTMIGMFSDGRDVANLSSTCKKLNDVFSSETVIIVEYT